VKAEFVCKRIEINLIDKKGSNYDGYTQVVYFLSGSNPLVSGTREFRKTLLFKPEQTAQIELFEKMLKTGDYSEFNAYIAEAKFRLVRVATPKYYLLDDKDEIRVDSTGEPIIKDAMSVLVMSANCLNDNDLQALALSEAMSTIKRICKLVDTNDDEDEE
jgi:hypothetical protein